MSRRSPASAPLALVIAGGTGTRLWPLSTDERPKQFLPLVSERPMIVETVRRLAPLVRTEDVRFATNRRYSAAMHALFPEVPASACYFEPTKRNTAPAIAHAVLRLLAGEPAERVLAILPADQWVARPAPFRAALAAAARRASSEAEIVTLGVRPDRPETGYGYLRPAPGEGPRALRAFVEKPPLRKAAEYVRRGYLWNAGIFVATLGTFREAFASCAPDLLEAAAAAASARSGKAFADAWERIPSISFDYAVAERFPRVGVVPVDCGWSDVGGFRAAWELRKKDRDGNVRIGDVRAEGCRDCLLWADGVELRVSGRRGAVIAATSSGALDAELPERSVGR